MAPKTKRIVDIIATAIPSGLVLLSGTMKLGFILLSCYFAGAMATELSHGMAPASPAITLCIIWIGAFIRGRSIFLPH